MIMKIRGRSLLKAAISIAAILLVVVSCEAQSDLEKAVKQFDAQQVTGYIQPVTDLFGTNMNSGYSHSGAISTWGFYFRLDIVGMASMIQDAQKTYDALTPAGFNPGSFQAPTVFGGKATRVTDLGTGLTYSSPADGVINASVFPLIVPQLTLGNIFGTQVVIRYVTLPKMSGDNIPNLTMWGLGARHSISQYFPFVPVDMAAGIYFNSFTFGDFFDFKGVAVNAVASKSFSILTLYGMLQWEKSTMNLSYTPSDAMSPVVNLSMTGANTFRFTAGLELGLGPIKLFGDANFGSVTAFSAGIGFGG